MNTPSLRRAGYTIALAVCVLLHTAAFAAEKPKDDIDYLALAALMIRDGHYDRAGAVLDNVDTEDENTDLPQYYTLKGLVLLKNGVFSEARQAFTAAIEHGQQAPVVQVYLAQAYYGEQQWQAAVDALDKAGEEGRGLPELFILRSRCYWHMRDRQSAWSALREGLAGFAGHTGLIRQQVFYLVELKLFKQALEKAQALLQDNADTPADILAVAEALIQSGQALRAIELLEQLRLRHPENRDVTLALAHGWHKAGKPLAAAWMFEQLSHTEPAFAFETAELYRLAGRYRQALYWNARIDDQKKKIRQRLGILLQLEQFEMASGLEARLSRLGLLEDEDIRYALAYAYYKIHDFDRSEFHLKYLTRQDLFRNANNLRLAMESCRANTWECY